MPRIFISYRRDDSQGFAGRIYDKLVAHFGAANIFMDVDAIPFGVDFRRHLADAVAQCDVLLALIGDRWLTASAGTGRRLDDPGDFVRIEIETALQRDIQVIPLLLGKATMPHEHELPGVLKALVYRNAAEVDAGRDFHTHMDRLIRALDQARQQAEAAERESAQKHAEAARLQSEQRAIEEGLRKAREEAQLFELAQSYQAPAPTHATSPVSASREICVVGHSTLFFWWPVWFVAFVNGFITQFTSASGPNLGVLFMSVLMLVVAITNLRARGLWPMIVVGVLIVMAVVFAWLGLWDSIFTALGVIDVRFNAVAYFGIGGIFFAAWCVGVFLLDRGSYIVFSPGQIRVCLKGEAEMVYDSTGIMIQTGRDDLLLHFILGMGSGELMVRTAGAYPTEFRLDNVLWVKAKMQAIENMLMVRY